MKEILLAVFGGAFALLVILGVKWTGKRIGKVETKDDRPKDPELTKDLDERKAEIAKRIKAESDQALADLFNKNAAERKKEKGGNP